MKTIPPLFDLSKVPTVAPSPGLVDVFSLVEKAHELYHAGRWLLLEEAQTVHLNPVPGRAPSVYLRLEGPDLIREYRTIDRTTGLVDVKSFRLHTGPVLIRPVDALVRARLRGSTS